jgi:pimeloyl-ACP methyl ester carboxylesterase
MSSIRIENGHYIGSNERKSLYDLHIPEHFNGKLVVFVHGYKGFKDWGPWNLVDYEFTSAGFGFAKFNLSHNGGNHIYAKDFPDLEAFSKNTYSKEVDDIIHFMNHLESLQLPKHSIHLIGHSRGGGVGLIAAAEDSRIDSITTWAAISSIEKRMPTGDQLEAWRKEGVRYELNSRTHQQMPILFSMYEDFASNKERLNIQRACTQIKIPRMVIHGSADESVKIEEGRALAEWLNVPLIEIPGANHTFGGVHPMIEYALPKDLKTVVDLTMGFIGNLNG